jgi:hypothetical protein
MNDEPIPERGVYRVIYTMQVGDRALVAESDLIIQDGRPVIVLEWGGPPVGQFPILTLPLDLAFLEERPGMPGYFLYDGQLVDPRTPH